MNVDIYGADWCTVCKQAVMLCKTNSVNFSYIDVDDTSNLRLLEERVGNKVRSLPQIFINGQHLQNGYTGLQQEIQNS